MENTEPQGKIAKVGFIGYPLSYTDSVQLATVSRQFPQAIWLLGTTYAESGCGLFYEQVLHMAAELGHAIQYINPNLNAYRYEDRTRRNFERILDLSDWLVVCWNNIERDTVWEAYNILRVETPRRFQLLTYYQPNIPAYEAAKLRNYFGNLRRRLVR